MILRLDQVVLRLVRVVVVRNIRVRHRDLRVDLLGEQLIDGQRATDIVLHIVQRVVAGLQLLR